ncbi:MAG: YbhB/YbcL family Raf kinase inhibitor-like protein [Myxococcota bacterium]
MKVWSDSFEHDGPMDERLAFGTWDPEQKIALADNRNPHLAWSDLPEGTKSLAIVCCDPDAPSKPDDVNQEGKTVPADLPRVDFYHWALVDLDPSAGSIAEGAFCDGITPKGKSGPEGPNGTRQGLNNYTQWFEGDEDMGGRYFGYDGPCPPWNDALLHHYHFTVYALDVERCPVEGTFDAPAVLQAIDGHVLGKATTTGTYAINPDVSS